MVEIRTQGEVAKLYLLASDFDQTLSFNDSGLVLSELLGTSGLGAGDMEKIASRLIRQVLTRERNKDGTITILHILGLPLGEWLMENIPSLRQ